MLSIYINVNDVKTNTNCVISYSLWFLSIFKRKKHLKLFIFGVGVLLLCDIDQSCLCARCCILPNQPYNFHPPTKTCNCIDCNKTDKKTTTTTTKFVSSLLWTCALFVETSWKFRSSFPSYVCRPNKHYHISTKRIHKLIKIHNRYDNMTLTCTNTHKTNQIKSNHMKWINKNSMWTSSTHIQMAINI